VTLQVRFTSINFTSKPWNHIQQPKQLFNQKNIKMVSEI